MASNPGTQIGYYDGQWGYGELKGRDILGLYLQDTWAIHPKFSVNAGVRYDDYSDFGNSVNPRAGVVYQITDRSNAKLLYGRAFRAPTFSELYQKNNPVTAGNANLDPLKVDTVELNVNHYPGSRLVNSVSLFYNQYKDLIVHDTTVVPSPSLNLEGKQKDLGAEWEMRYKVDRYKYATVNFSHIAPQDGNGNLRPDIARNRIGAVLNYDVLPAKVVVNVNGFYKAGRINPLGAANPDHKVKDAAVLNANFRVLNLLPRTDLDLSFFDVTDEQWRSPGLPASVELDNVPNRGFQWLAKLTFTF